MSQKHFINKTDPSDPLKREDYGEVPRKLWLPLVSMLKKVCEGSVFGILASLNLQRLSWVIRSFFKLLLGIVRI